MNPGVYLQLLSFISSPSEFSNHLGQNKNYERWRPEKKLHLLWEDLARSGGYFHHLGKNKNYERWRTEKTFGAKRKLKKNWCVVWLQAEIKHGKKKIGA